MKELSTEEKAKAYDEAIERAKKWYNAPNIDKMPTYGNRVIEEIFPELKESEDEMIRKELIEHVKDQQSSFISAPDCRDKYEEEENNKYNSWIAWLEKQGDDKVVPKFKIGDWVVFNNKHQSIYQVEKIEDGYYILRHTHGGTFRVCVLHDECLRPWTIRDAKDGDMLAMSAGAFIYNGNNGGGSCPGCYCGINTLGNFKVGVEHHWTGRPVFPATKEQRDLLFQKMKEAGYEWDAEKKELKEIEDEEYNGEDYGIDSLFHAQRILEKTLGKVDGYQSDDGILEHKCAITSIKKLYEQKPAWSEEDENYLNTTIAYLKDANEFKKTAEKCITWLKSFRPQPKQWWSEEDTSHLKEAVKKTINFKNDYEINRI